MTASCATSDLWIAARQVSVRLEREADRILSGELGLSTTTYALLSTLNSHEGHITQHGIAELLGITKSSVSRHMDAATAAGYLAPSASPVSRRDRTVELTSRGLDIVAQADKLVEAILPGAATDRDVEAALEALGTIGARLPSSSP